jgi:hypothetical protein
MMELIPIKVECHSGYKADEYPKYFYRDDERFEIQEITDRWYQGDSDPKFPVSNYFKVKTDSGEIYLIKHDLNRDEWYLCQSS